MCEYRVAREGGVKHNIHSDFFSYQHKLLREMVPNSVVHHYAFSRHMIYREKHFYTFNGTISYTLIN